MEWLRVLFFVCSFVKEFLRYWEVVVGVVVKVESWEFSFKIVVRFLLFFSFFIWFFEVCVGLYG